MNTAGRILAIYDRLTTKGLPHDQPMVKIWTTVLEIPQSDRHVEDDVVQSLQALRAEVDLLRSKILALGATEELLHPCIARLRNVTSTVHLNHTWSALREDAVRPEVRLSLLWANWALRGDSEGELSNEALASLQAELQSLEQSLLGTEMSAYLREFIQRQIDLIRTALCLYQVKGIRPIEEALHQVAGAYVIEQGNIDAAVAVSDPPAKSVFVRVTEFVKKTAELADSVEKIRKAGEGVAGIAAKFVPVLLTWIQTHSQSN